MCSKSQSRQEVKRNDSISVIVHDFAVVGPLPASNMSFAKGLAAERARQILDDPTSEYYLPNICDCAQLMDIDGEPPTFEMPKDMLNDETEAGFAALARIAVVETSKQESKETQNGLLNDEDDSEEMDENLNARMTGVSDYVEGALFSMPED